MNKALDLIDDIDRLLAEADENLAALKAMHDEVKSLGSCFVKMESLVKKYDAASTALLHDKAWLLGLLIQALQLIDQRRVGRYHLFDDSIVDTTSVIRSSFTRAELCRSPSYYIFCSEAIHMLAKYFRATPADISDATKNFEDLLAKFNSLSAGRLPK